jgi:hypothetical protein
MSSDYFIHYVVPGDAADFDVMDTRTKTIVATHATLPLAQADVIARNRTVAGL